MTLAPETLGFRRTGLSPVFSLLMPASSLLVSPHVLIGRASIQIERSPTTPTEVEVRGFGGLLKPRYIIGAAMIDQ